MLLLNGLQTDRKRFRKLTSLVLQFWVHNILEIIDFKTHQMSDKSANEHKIQCGLTFPGTIICFHDPSALSIFSRMISFYTSIRGCSACANKRKILQRTIPWRTYKDSFEMYASTSTFNSSPELAQNSSRASFRLRMSPGKESGN